jgi:oligoribonuclease NrnB/cAMP/cGMP phosphodiesterase (DHH superfamily)
MKCFHHDDADGMCAGYWVASSVIINDREYYNDKPEFYEMNYRKKFPIEIIRHNEQVYIVDFSISPDEMSQLLKITRNVTWIDHHKTAIEKYKDFDQEIRGLRYDGISACMLTYCYVKHMTVGGEGDIKKFDKSMTNDAPMFTKYIADSDVFDFKYGDDTRNFFTALKAYDFGPTSEKWEDFAKISNYEMKMIEEGRVISSYKKALAKDYLNLGFETLFEGHRCFAVNYGYSGIGFFDSLPEGLYDAFISFAFDGTQHVVSMYSKKVDVSYIAKKYGGGGHKMAAGFQCEKLPFSRIAG